MFEVKDSKQIGAYIKKLIYSKYPSQRQFCIEYIKKMGFDETDSVLKPPTFALLPTVLPVHK